MMKKLILMSSVLYFLIACNERVDTAKFRDEIRMRKVMKIMPVEIMATAHEVAEEIKSGKLKDKKYIDKINLAQSLDDCETEEEKTIFNMMMSASQDLKKGKTITTPPVIHDKDILIFTPSLKADSTIQAEFLYLNKKEIIIRIQVREK